MDPLEDDEDLAPTGVDELSRESVLAEARKFVDPGAKYRARGAAALKPAQTFSESMYNSGIAFNSALDKESELTAKYAPLIQRAAIARQVAKATERKAEREREAQWNTTLDSTAGSMLLNPDLSQEAVGQAVQGLVTQGRVPGELAAKFMKSLPKDPVALRSMLTQQAIARSDPNRAVAKPVVEKYGEGEVGYAVGPDGKRTEVARGAAKQTDVERLITARDALPPGDPRRVTLDAAITKATTHAPNSTSIIMPAERPLINNFMTELGKSAGASRDGALAAKSSLSTAQRLARVLEDPMVSGPGANAEVVVRQLAEWGGYGGKTNRERLINTRQALQAMAQLELDAAAQMKGQGAITDSERKILARAASGDITMTVPEMRVLAAVSQRVARRRIAGYNAYANKLKKLEGMDKVAELLEVEEEDDPGADLRFDSNGRLIKN